MFKIEYRHSLNEGSVMKIGYRTLKTAIGVAISVSIAQLLHLQFAPSAGIITILCIKESKKRSLISAIDRILACLIGMIVAISIFELTIYHPMTLAIVILFFIPLAVLFRVQEGIVTSSVIILHLYSLETISWAIIQNELLLITIGVLVALLMNVYMPSLEKPLNEYKEKIEHHFSVIFIEFSKYLRHGDRDWDGTEFYEVYNLLEQAKSLAFRNVENHVLRNDDEFYQYFQMREKQLKTIERLMRIISLMDRTIIHAEPIAALLEDVSRSIHPGNTIEAQLFQERLYQMKEEYRKMPLPVLREEFETRSQLFYFILEMEEYFVIERTCEENKKNR